MPFYEYQCSACGHHLEAMQKISDAPLKKCPECGKSRLQRLVSAPVFRLKGGGWYETDFKTEKDQKRNLADKPEAEAPKDDKKDKPAAKPVEKPAEKASAGSQSKPKPAKAAKKAAAKSKRRG